ncbi:hypothetical protein [Mycolicibacterium fluoranthenivorans]|uniref:Uncharacterized protein n=1 Tax=Mycolicibacterium fluoranthenivorans TaxID=258505 RepID=A0A1G4W361_9MYCO|nr:hypothetical protein [Mycolicibacterium fluoranthenivorans]SCX15242.1 hypothetical protein SAMN02799620_02022 [Mycolicibacterium fluoranthenivorans]
MHADQIPERLVELADLAENCRTAFLRNGIASHWQPTYSSPAAGVQATLEQRDRNSFTLVSEVLVTYLEIAAAHLSGMAVLYRSGEAMFPPVPLARSVMELSAHAVWVIGSIADTADDILARAYLEELTSLEAAKFAAGKMHSKESAVHQAARQRWSEFRKRVMTVFPETTKADLGASPPAIAGQRLPRPEDCIENLFDRLRRSAGGTITNEQARGAYSFLCAGTHPSLYHARQLRVHIKDGHYTRTVLKADVASLERLVTMPVIAYYGALSYMIDFYGLDRAALDELTARIDEILPTVLR